MKMWSLLLIVLPVMTIFGNSLIVLSIYKERSLRNATNFFIVSLACADILVGILVMPLAVYVEIEGGVWSLGNLLCDAWIAADVMVCTASILHLMAISIDRYYAVTKPIEYRKQTTLKRVYITIGLAWFISAAIASPIVIGINYSEERNRTPKMCVFYNSLFIMLSSIGSFYAPCIVIFVLYGRIFYILRLRQKKKKALKKKTANEKPKKYDSIDKANQQSDTTERCNTEDTLLKTVKNCKSSVQFSNSNDSDIPENQDTAEQTISPSKDEPLLSKEEHNSSELPKNLLETLDNNVILTCEYTEIDNQSQNDFRYSCEPCNQIDTFPDKKTKKSKSKFFSRAEITKKFSYGINRIESGWRNKSILREKKITVTLAVVLGVFLLCWIPFFTANNVRAVCALLKISHKSYCEIDGNLMSIFVWLGYINSSLNPIIYTIFNSEFRKVFHKLLTGCNFHHHPHLII